MDDIKAKCIFNEQVHVKEEEEDSIKEEQEWEDNAGLHGISAAAAKAGLYANHEVKDKLVLRCNAMDDIKAECIFNEQVHVKEEEDNIKEEPEWEDNAGLHGISAAAARAGLYANHEVKDKLGLRRNAMDDIKAECIFNEQVHVKEEEDTIKEEPEWEDNAGLYGISAAAAGLYANHEVKDELVLGPEGVQPADIAFTLYARGAQREGREPARDRRGEGREPARGGRGEGREPARGGRGEGREPVRGGRGQGREPARGGREEGREPARGGREEGREAARGGRGEGREPARGEREEGREPTRAQDFRHVCLLCCKNFPTPSQLKTHERTHTGERRFSCGICQQKFTRLYHLTNHERIHTGQRPFSCRICKQKFTQLSNLKSHERIHTGEKPFSCGICKQKFTTSTHLKRHERSHTREKPFACDVCKKQFTELRNLKEHEGRFHADRKPFCCDICQKWFAQKTTLVGHIRRHRTAKPR